jgi:GH25 family lysozyme M1 (1,4-beta-N-acetylmuramidase)
LLPIMQQQMAHDSSFRYYFLLNLKTRRKFFRLVFLNGYGMIMVKNYKRAVDMKKWFCILLTAVLLSGFTLPALADEEEIAGEGCAQADGCPYSDGDILSEGTIQNPRYAMYDTLKGIDVSVFQRTIDWAKVAAAGVKFAVIRIGGRFSTTGDFYNDENFNTNISGALANGIQVGVYFVSQAINETEAVDEANYVLNNLGSWANRLTLPVYLDEEYVSGSAGRLFQANLTKDAQTNIALTFCNTIHNAGLKAGVYASFLTFNISADTIYNAGYSIWHAQYAASSSLQTWYDQWQYSSSGTIDGISGAVDMDYLYCANCLTGFTDIDPNGWYYDSVRYAVENKLFFGMSDTQFAPNNPMTREMFVTVLYRLAGTPSTDAVSAFQDVTDPSAYYYHAVAWAAENGIVSGMGDGTFGVGRSITRQEMAVFMKRYAAWAGLSVSAAGTGTAGFSDRTDIASWAQDAMDWATENGILCGMSGTELAPLGTSTRAQVATVLRRLAVLINQ